MTDRPKRFEPVEGDFEQIYRRYDGACIVFAFFRFIDWWLAYEVAAGHPDAQASLTQTLTGIVETAEYQERRGGQ